MKNIILLGGKAGSGKDFVGSILVRDYEYKRFGLADYLKDIVACNYGIPRDELDTQEGKAKLFKDGMSYRDLLIKTSYFHKYKNINVFTDFIIRDMKADPSKNYVITDFRFPHEYEKISSELSKFFNVITINVQRKSSIFVDDDSERALDNFTFDFTLDNNFDESNVKKELAHLFL
jgi:hypothetical protein